MRKPQEKIEVSCKKCNKKWMKNKYITSEKYWNGFCLSCCKVGRKQSKETVEKRTKNYKGKGNPFYGKTHRKETLDRIKKTKEINNSLYAGDRHWNWRGGVTLEDKKERARFFKYIRPKVFERDNYTCQECKIRGGYIQVDHVKDWANYPELRFNLDNCLTLCMKCHYRKTFNKELPEGTIWGHNFSKSEITLGEVTI